MRSPIPAALVLLCLAFAAGAEEAPDHPALRDQFYLGAGAYFAQTTTQAQLDSNRFGAGTNVDFEDALGMDRTTTVPTFFGRMRLGERWRFEAEYFQLNRHGNRQIDRNIQWGDNTYTVNAQLESTFNFSDLRMSAGYSFYKTRDKELGVGIGAHVASYKVSLSAPAIGSETEGITAPLPVGSVYGQMALDEHWAVGARLDRFVLKYDKYDGSLTAMAIDVLYQPFRHVGFGLGVRDLFISLNATDEQKTARFRQTFQGPVLFMNVSF